MIEVQTWCCNRCGNTEAVEIFEEGDGIIGEWMCSQSERHGPMCGGLMVMKAREGSVPKRGTQSDRGTEHG